jgi:hypothetical protein
LGVGCGVGGRSWVSKLGGWYGGRGGVGLVGCNALLCVAGDSGLARAFLVWVMGWVVWRGWLG